MSLSDSKHLPPLMALDQLAVSLPLHIPAGWREGSCYLRVQFLVPCGTSGFRTLNRLSLGDEEFPGGKSQQTKPNTPPSWE